MRDVHGSEVASCRPLPVWLMFIGYISLLLLSWCCCILLCDWLVIEWDSRLDLNLWNFALFSVVLWLCLVVLVEIMVLLVAVFVVTGCV